MTVLPPMPDRFAATLLALHRLAVYVVSPARRLATGNEIALAPTPGGFGTPAGESWGQLRVAGDELVARRGAGDELVAPITSLRAAATFAGIEPDLAAATQFDVPPPGELDASLAIELASSELLAAFYALVGGALDELKGGLGPADDASPVHLWPEHFDVAIDAGDAARSLRGSWGGSPGDGAHPEPYLYVSRWSGAPADPFFSETAFAGASLGYDVLRAAPDPHARALAFWREARIRLI
ncbi:MAG: hypothetical protein ABI317_03230 [Gaiellales bacterium]